MGVILFDRRIAVLHSDRQSSLVTGDGGSCTAEVDQTDLAVFQHQVVRADVTVDQPFFMQRGQRTEQRFDHIKQFFWRDFAAFLFDQFFQRGTFYIFHDNVGRVVFFKEVAHGNDLRRLVHQSHGLCFLQEAFLSILVNVFRANVHADVLGRHGVTCRFINREVFLDRNFQTQNQVSANVCNAEAAFAKESTNQIALLQNRARRNMVFQWGVCAFCQSALLAHTVFIGL